MEQNNEKELDIRDAAAIAFGLLSSRATSHDDRERNRSQAMKLIWAAINGRDIPNEERLRQPVSKKKEPPEYGKIAVSLDGSIDGRCGFLTVDINDVVDSLLDQARDRQAVAKKSSNHAIANEAEMLYQAVMLIRRAY